MSEITAREIFEKNQILTIARVKEIVGKKIAITNSEYRHNSPSIRIFKVLGIQNEFEAAAQIKHATHSSLQEMWLLENNHQAIHSAQKRTLLIFDGDKPFAVCEEGNSFLPDGTFFGSDADREIYYQIIE